MKTALPLLLITALAGSAFAGPVRDHRVVAELIPEMDAIVPGKKITICLNIKHDPKWHTYWKNPGIAGVPTKLDWDLPEGFKAGPIQWARPQVVKMAIYNTYGFEGEVTLLVDIETPSDLKPGTEVELKTKTTWMMCAETCHPSSAKLSVKVPVAASAKPHEVGSKLAAATRSTMPVANKEWKATARLRKKSATITLTSLADDPPNIAPEDLYFFSDDGVIDSHPEQVITRKRPGVYKMVLQRAEFGPKNPSAITGVLLNKSGDQSKALFIRAELKPKSEG